MTHGKYEEATRILNHIKSLEFMLSVFERVCKQERSSESVPTQLCLWDGKTTRDTGEPFPHCHFTYRDAEMFKETIKEKICSLKLEFGDL